MFPKNSWAKLAVAAGFLTIVLGFAYHVAHQPMDFRVYHYGARGVFDGTRPVYGETSGLGWPMHYRYPPLFLLLFAPFAALPLGLAAAIWLMLKVLFLAVLSKLFLRHAIPSPLLSEEGWLRHQENVAKPPKRRRRGGQDAETLVLSDHPGASRHPSSERRGLLALPAAIVAALLAAPYLIEEFRYGNAQFFVFALTAAALLLSRRKPEAAAASLALAISIKVWPLFFVPYLAVRRDWKVVGYALAFVAVLALLPSIYFGVSGNFNLLGQWFNQESHTQLSESEIWFPNQSLRGVLMRYLTVIDYSQVPDANYAQVNLAAMNPVTVRWIWMMLAGTIYAAFLFVENRRRDSDGWLDHGLAFCLLAMLEPFTQKYALVVLLWPAIAAAGLMKERGVRILIYSAVALALIQPLAPGATAQRFLQVIGLDFAATLILTVALAIPIINATSNAERVTTLS